MQWTPFDVKVMEHAQRIDRVNRMGWVFDQLTVTTTEPVPVATPSRPHIVATLTASVRALVARRLPANSDYAPQPGRGR